LVGRRRELVRRRRRGGELVMDQKEFLARLDQQRIVEAIRAAENATSGEIRVHVQPKARGGDLRFVAERTFERLGMTKTAARNGVLLFIASEEQGFVILGDRGIDERVPAGFWDEIAAQLTIRFKNGEFTEGIVDAITAAGEHLKEFFPRAADDVNELSDDIDVSDE
ncbi:MAG TPA: TPM domain-containing protein, partial [Thermoanaerobaculia bacterium]|nr:TPM domain-containing protein [Thermoanaerobaculia bacterium]